MASGIRDSGIVFLSRVLSIVLGLATQSVLAWFLGTDGRGSYAVCIVFSTMLGLIFMLGSDVASLYFVASKRFTPSEGVVYHSLLACFGIAASVLAGLVAMRLPLEFFRKAPDSAFYLALVHLGTFFFASTLPQLLTALHDFLWSAIVNTATAVVNVLLALVLLWVFPGSVNAAMVAVIGSCLFSICFALIVLRKRHNVTWIRPSFRPLLDMVKYGFRYYVGKLSNQVNFRVGTIILAFFASEADIGLFSVASLLTAQVMMIPDTLGTVLMPRVASNKGGRTDLVAQCSRVTGVICAVVLLVLSMVATPLTKLLFSSEFLPMVPLIRILAMGVFFRCLSKIFVPYLIGTNRPGTASLAVSAGVVTNLLLLWFLLPRVGLNGAAIAMAGNYLVSSLILISTFVVTSKMSVWQVFRLRSSDWEPLRVVWLKVTRRG